VADVQQQCSKMRSNSPEHPLGLIVSGAPEPVVLGVLIDQREPAASTVASCAAACSKIAEARFELNTS